MNYKLAKKLEQKLKQYCPVDSGALRASIQPLQGDISNWVIVIGNQSGAEINGSCATIEYASITNFAKTLQLNGKQYPNRNYHWVNRAIKEWASENAIEMNILNEESEDALDDL